MSDVVIQEEHIIAVRPAEPGPIQPGEIDGTDLYAIPGLVDGHVHLTVPNYPDRMRADLNAALLDGVTSVREMGGDVPAFRPLADSSQKGDPGLPRIFYAALLASDSWFAAQHFPVSFAAGHRPWLASVEPASDPDPLIRAAAGAGVTGIKLTSGIAPEDVEALSRAAHAVGLRVWSHAAVHPGRPSDAIRAGVDVLSHATLLAWETQAIDWTDNDNASRWMQACRALAGDAPRRASLFVQMRISGTLLEPTLAASRHQRPPGRKGLDPVDACGIQLTRDAHAAGISLVAGTDFFLQRAGRAVLHEELHLLVRDGGLSPREALQAATVNAARAVGQQGSLGRLRPGFLADVVLLSADPTIDIDNADCIVAVIKAGRLRLPPFSHCDTAVAHSSDQRWGNVIRLY